ncbi:type VII secretion protein EssC [Paenibacillus dakarensis]|uniref:type VII secretion protein EssC n=1 Tax=Paenibacillus dakarensis TaxID=1527293 RepID=UPI0006D58E81|nr:type VII secretion protein EssC [Paenibacillus dakarensis]
MNVMYQRSPRIRPALHTEEMEILRPPSEPNKPSFSLISIIIPIIMTVATISLYVYMNVSGKMANSNMMMFQMLSIFMMLTSYTLPFFMYLGNKKTYQKKIAERNMKYRHQLDLHREELKQRQQDQVEVMYDIHGDPDVCFQIAKNRASSLWERSPEDTDFLDVRVGKGTIPFHIQVKAPRADGYEKDPLIEAAQELAGEFQTVEEASITLPLFESKVIGIVGGRENVLNMLRVIIAQTAVRHSPDEVKTAAFFEEKEAHEWDWLRWLPHTWDDDRSARYLANRRSSAHKLADELFMQLFRRKNNRSDYGSKSIDIPAYIVILSNAQLIEEEPLLPLLLEDGEAVDAVTIILSDRKENLPMHCQLIVEVEREQAVYTVKHNGAARQQAFKTDGIGREQMEALARYMAPIRLKRSSASDIPAILTLFEMMEIDRISELDVKDRWEKNRYPDSLPVPIGVRAGNKKINLNLHDKIERQGHGPHGLIAGTTGSGKSEVIQSIVASLAAEFHPHDLAFMLIDYKGGGMSNTFLHLPHVVGTITNLDNNLIERAKISLKAELVRRQKILNDAGNLQHIDEYYKLLRNRHGEPLPHLVIIIDEFAQLKKDQPEFMDELISIAAIGRTLGVHLILATQKPAGVVDDKIWSNSRFRICLRVQSEGDSRDMLKIPNAAWINKSGRGYFQVGSDELFEEMQFAWSGAPYIEEQDTEDMIDIREVHLNGKTESMLSKANSSGRHHHEVPKQLQVFIDRVAEIAREEGIERLQGPWLPPLPESLDLDVVMSQADESSVHTLGELSLTACVGMVDDLPNQCQTPLRLNIEQGHFAVYGMPGLGKTTFVQTLLMSLSQRYTPDQWHGYVIDMGRMMRDFSGLPHIGAVMTAEEDDRIKRLFRFLTKTAGSRKELIAEAGVKTIAAYRRAFTNQVPQILIVIDGYLNFRNMYPDENDALEYLLREGGSLGITFVITANRISDMFEKVRSNIQQAVSFELADPADYYYAVGRPSRAPNQLPPGRGLVKGQTPPLEFQTALSAPGQDEGERTAELRKLIDHLKQSWNGEAAPSIDSLPEKIILSELLKVNQPYEEIIGTSKYQVPVGLATDDLSPYFVDLEEGPHFIVASPMEGGKTSFLLSWMLSLAYHTSPDDLEIYTVDTRYGSNGLSRLNHLPHVKGFAENEEDLGPLISGIYEKVQKRTKESADSAILLLIDDADVMSKQLNDFTLKDQLSSIVRQGRDRKVHVVLSGVPADFPTYGVDWFTDVKASQAGFLFGTLDSNDLSFFRIPFSESANSPGGLKLLPPGQGYYIKRKFSRIKGAVPYDEVWNAQKWITEIRDRWHVVV